MNKKVNFFREKFSSFPQTNLRKRGADTDMVYKIIILLGILAATTWALMKMFGVL